MARGWAISGISDQTREAVTAAAGAAGISVGAWIEQTLRQAFEAKAEASPPPGIEIDEIEAMVRRVTAEELQPIRGVLARMESMATTPAISQSSANGSPINSMRERLRQRRVR